MRCNSVCAHRRRTVHHSVRQVRGTVQMQHWEQTNLLHAISVAPQTEFRSTLRTVSAQAAPSQVNVLSMLWQLEYEDAHAQEFMEPVATACLAMETSFEMVCPSGCCSRRKKSSALVAKDFDDSAAVAGQFITRSVRQWTRLVRKLFRIRRLQRFVGHIGQHLKSFGPDMRQYLQKYLPKIT